MSLLTLPNKNLQLEQIIAQQARNMERTESNSSLKIARQLDTVE